MKRTPAHRPALSIQETQTIFFDAILCPRRNKVLWLQVFESPRLAALGPFADGRSSTLTGRRVVQEPDIQPRSTRRNRLLNHPVRAQQQRLGNCDPERPRRLQVDDQFIARWLIDG